MLALMTKEELSERVQDLGEWHHCHKFPYGIITGQPPGDHMPGMKMTRLIQSGAFPKPSYPKVLDLGANSGIISMWFVDNKHSHVVAVERGERYFPQLELAVEVKGYRGKIECRNEDIYDAEYGENLYDLVLLLGVLHHMNSEVHLEILQACRRALKFGGEMVLETRTAIPGTQLLTQAGFRRARKLYDDPSYGKSGWAAKK